MLVDLRLAEAFSGKPGWTLPQERGAGKKFQKSSAIIIIN
jgi:hypothetical protein